MSKFRRLKGMRDLFGEELAKLRRIEGVVRELFRLYGYEEVLTPTLESFELVEAKCGEEIRLRMYAFQDLGGRKVVLRPDMTSPIARFVASELKAKPLPIRLGYIANVFRYDNPQRGRYREFWQAGFELIGSSDPSSDAEILDIACELMERLKLERFTIKIGHVGILYGLLEEAGFEQREQYKIASLIDKGREDEVIPLLDRPSVPRDVREAIKNLFEAKGSPEEVLNVGRRILSRWEKPYSCLENLSQILDLISYRKADFLVYLGFARGLEYYTGMIFEVYVPGFDMAVGGGGRYDELIRLFGGKDLPAVGYSAGMDRLALVLPPFEVEKLPSIVVLPVGREYTRTALEVAARLRKNGLIAQPNVCGWKLSRALSQASKLGYKYAIIIGKEWRENRVAVKDLEKGVQVEVPSEKVFSATSIEDFSEFFPP